MRSTDGTNFPDARTHAAWVNPNKVGDIAPMQRVTISRLNMGFINYDLAKTEGSIIKGTGKVASAIFMQKDRPVELPNVKSVDWKRSIDQDFATLTLTLWNTEPLPLGDTPTTDSTVLDRPGYFTFNRGFAPAANARWGYTKNGWKDLLVYDRILRTYEGYGYDPDLTPENDPAMWASGVWLIDEVDYNAEGDITVTARDVGRLLGDQIMYPPVVPFPQYPLVFSKYEGVDNPDKHVTTAGGWHRPKFDKSSNYPYNAVILGHRGTDAFDKSEDTYWISVGNDSPSRRYAYEYVQGSFSSRTVTAVRVHAWAGPYQVYISLYDGNKWLGRHKVPYHQDGVGLTDANEHFVYQGNIGKGDSKVFKLPKAYDNITKVRVTFHHLFNSGRGPYKYRAGCRSVDVTGSTTKVVDGGQHTEGSYGDYTDIVKWLLAWGGFFWPKDSAKARYVETDGTTVTMAPSSADDTFPGGIGRVWGDFENTGTAGEVDLGVQTWDKKPLMDGINVVKDIIGFVFFIDETGGAVWRSPNIYKKGNWFNSISGGAHGARTSSIITIDENTTLVGLSAKVSSRNIRERIFVANSSGAFGALAQGFNPFPSGIRRVGGWTDQHFKNRKESKRMAGLIALRQAFQMRTDTVTIPGNPAIQIDDQVRIYEAVTGETYIHYVRGISSKWDATTRKWTYTLETHWLGDNPNVDGAVANFNWAFTPSSLDEEVQKYLKTIGAI